MASSLSNTASATVSADEKTSAIASAPLANPIAAHPPALALAPPVQLGEPLRGSDPASTDATDLAASTSSKPVRPPRAVQRPSTASRRTSASGAESVAGTNPAAAFTSGNGVSSDANASEGTTLVGAGTAESSVPEMSSVEKVDDAAAKAAIQESAGTPVPTANSSTVTGSSADKRPSTVSQTVVADDSATSTPKSGAAAEPVSSTSANNNLDTTTPPRTSSPAAATGTAGTSRPRTAQPTTSSASAKKRKGGFSLLACLPCFGSTGHEEDPPQQLNAPARRASPAPRVTETEKQQEKAPQAASSDVPVVPEAEPAVAANESPVVVENEKAVPAEGTDSPVAVTSPIVEPTSAVVASTDDAVSQPGPTAPAAHNGVVLPADETEGVTSGAVVPPGQVAASQVPHPPTPTPRQRRRRAKQQQQARSGTEGIITSVPEPGAVGGGILLAPRHDETTSSEISTDEEDDEDDIDESEEEEEEEDEEQMLIARGGVGIPIGEDGLPHPLLDELSSDLHGRKCLVLDLDETLVHSSFKMVHQADFVVPVEIENQFHNVYVIKRPGVDAFLKAMGEIYEVVVFTASLSKYADPVLDHLDIHRVVKHRLFRESCYNNKGNYVKDLSQLGRPISECIIIDNSPASYVFHPNNAVPISSWFNDPHDTELTDLIPFLADLSSVEDIRSVLDANLYLPSMIAEGTAVVGTGETDGISTALQQL